MSKTQTCITCTAVQMVTVELHVSRTDQRVPDHRIFSGYIVNLMKQVRSNSPDLKLVDEELYLI